MSKALSENHSNIKQYKVPMRNSSIELLRILAMLMILTHHFVLYNGTLYSWLDWGFNRAVLQFVFLESGKIGVIVFFAISAWYLVDKEQTIAKNVRRAWLLERELLFWSISLLILTFFALPQYFTPALAFQSLFPTINQLWWYTTSYIIFLCILPFLQKGLNALSKSQQVWLSIILIIIFGVIGVLPDAVRATEVFAFIFVYIIVRTFKLYYLYLSGKFMRFALVFTLMSLLVFSLTVYSLSRVGVNITQKLFGVSNIFTIISGLMIVLFFARLTFYSRFINYIAKSALSVYLITEFPPIRTVVWHEWLNLKSLQSSPLLLPFVIVSVICVYCACTLLDLVRRFIFKYTCDRNPGKWLDLLWNRIAHTKLYNRINASINASDESVSTNKQS